MNRNELDGLLALKVVAQKRNFTAAALELGISPPALSQTIKQLEKRLGVTLLSRTTRSTSLTEAGRKFLEEAGPAMEQILAALQDIGAYAKKPAGLLRLNALSYAYPSFLAEKVRSFCQKYPEISVEVFLDDAPSDIFDRGFDAGIRLSDILAKDLIAVKVFGPIRWMIAGSPGYFKKQQRPLHPKDLLGHNCLRVRSGEKLYDKWEFERRGKAFEVQVKGSLILNDPLLVAEAALDGMGLVYAPEDIIGDKLREGRLEAVLSDFSASSGGYYLYFPRRSQLQPKLRAFIEHLRSEKK